MAAKKRKVKAGPVRVKMTDAEVQKFLDRRKRESGLEGKEFEAAVHRCAATRWAALERNARRNAKAKKPKK